jgi:hypothetical protein
VATMAKRRMKRPATHGLVALAKTTTGIKGLDEVTGGGVPRGRPSLVCGPAGSGKTLLAMEFLVRGITQFGEPGVFVAFEETREDLVARRPRSARTRSTGKEDLEQRRAILQRERQAVEAQVAVLWRDFEDESDAVERPLSRGTTGREEGVEQRLEQGRLRRSDPRLPDDAAKLSDHLQTTP